MECNLDLISHLFTDFHLATAMDAFKGKFERTSADQYEEFLKVGEFFMFCFLTTFNSQALEVNLLLRKAATVSTPVCHISEEGGVWTIKSSTTLKSTELKFKVGCLASDAWLPLWSEFGLLVQFGPFVQYGPIFGPILTSGPNFD